MRIRLATCWVLAFATLSGIAVHSAFGQARDGAVSSGKSPAEALATMTVRPGWKIELVAAEPLVEDPVAFDWGADGSLWVAEMRDYPNGISWNKPGDQIGKPGGRVKRLVDKDGDGKFDESTLFLDDLPFPTGIKVWRDGVIVSTAPDVFFAADTNGDGKADRREVLLTGFREGNQQHRVNGLRWGLDNWLHLANGDSGGLIKSVRTGQSIPIGGRDLRFRPDTGEIDSQSGQTQFGRNRDDWGNWFGGNNANPMWHYVLEDHYLRRNSHVPSPDLRKHVSIQPGASPVFPTSVTPARFNDFNMSNRFTSACSPEVFRDEWPGTTDSTSHVLICEPVHNLVHHEVMTAEGLSFTSRRPDDERASEFLSSSDNWFRPVMVRTGPDGAIWVADMYRAVIEHTEWIPLDWQKRLDLRAGSDRGRIYRLVPDRPAARHLPKLDKLDDAGLVAALDSPSGWQRDMAQQMLLWRYAPLREGDLKSAPGPIVAALAELAVKALRPQTRLHALCTLDGLRKLTPELLESCFADSHPGVRRHVVRLSEPFLNDSPSLAKQVVARVGDADPQVRLQTAYSLGFWNAPASGAALATLALASADDPYLLAGVFSSARRENLPSLLAGVLRGDGRPTSSRVLEPILTTAAAMRDEAALREALARIATPYDGRFAPWQWESLAALLDALERRKLDVAHLGDDRTRGLVVAAVAAARVAADDSDRPLADRLAAVRLLGIEKERRPVDFDLLASFLSPRHPQELQLAAVQSLGRPGDQASIERLLAGWKSHGPAVRAQIAELVIGRESSTIHLIRAIERGDVPAAQMDARRRQQLETHRNADVRAAAKKLFASPTNPSRQELVVRYEQALRDLNGDDARGQQIYAKRCANCHRLAGAGHAVGPDLAAAAGKATDVLLSAVLDPSRAIEDRYLDYIVVTDDGRQLTGMLAAETGTSITLLAQEGKATTVLRSQIEELRSTGKSLMPEGLEREIAPSDFADLIAYLRRQAPPPKKFAGNEPATVRAGEDGVLRLLATTARIYGPSLVFEPQYRNLGYWSSPDDHATWTIEVPKAGNYQVTLDFACDDGAAGGEVTISIAGKTLGGRVEGTGTWDVYRSKGVGVIELPAGATELTIRSAGPIKSALIDLRGIRITPVK